MSDACGGQSKGVVELALFLHLYTGSGNQTEVVRFVKQTPYLLRHRVVH